MDQTNKNSPINIILSKLGILSLILGLGPLCVFLCYLSIPYYILFYSPPLVISENFSITMQDIISLSLICGSISGVLSLILGTASFIRKDQSRILPVLGIFIAIFGCITLPIVYIGVFIFPP